MTKSIFADACMYLKGDDFALLVLLNIVVRFGKNRLKRTDISLYVKDDKSFPVFFLALCYWYLCLCYQLKQLTNHFRPSEVCFSKIFRCHLLIK